MVIWDVTESAGVHCDIRDPSSIASAMEVTLSRFGTPTILIAAAGINGRRRLVDTTVDEWDRILEINARGTFLTMQAIAKAIIEDGANGVFTLVGSTAGTLADPETVPYSVSKAGLNHLARISAVELGPFGIRVNLINPGPTLTPMTERSLGRKDYLDLVVETTPLRGVGTAEHMAQAILGLIDMEWVTGQTLDVDGGTSLVTPRGAVRASFGSFTGGPGGTEYQREPLEPPTRSQQE